MRRLRLSRVKLFINFFFKLIFDKLGNENIEIHLFYVLDRLRGFINKRNRNFYFPELNWV